MADRRAKNKRQSEASHAEPSEAEAPRMVEASAETGEGTEARNDAVPPEEPVIIEDPEQADSESDWAEQVTDQELRRLEEIAEQRRNLRRAVALRKEIQELIEPPEAPQPVHLAAAQPAGIPRFQVLHLVDARTWFMNCWDYMALDGMKMDRESDLVKLAMNHFDEKMNEA